MADVLIKWEPWAQQRYGVAEWAPANTVVPDVDLDAGTVAMDEPVLPISYISDPTYGAPALDPDELFRQGFVYIGGKWIQSAGPDVDRARAAAAQASPSAGTLDPGPLSTSGVLVATWYDDRTTSATNPAFYDAGSGLGLINITLGVSGGVGRLAPIHMGQVGLAQVRLGDEGW